MRVLVATTAGSGHFGPLLPFARALRDAGHDVVVAAPAAFAPAVERAGFRHAPFADAPPEELGAVFGSLGGLSMEEGNAIMLREVFGRIDTRAALPGMRAIVDEVAPDLVLREPAEFSSYLAADAKGIPHAQVSVGLARFEQRYAPDVDEVLREFGSVKGVDGIVEATRLSLLPSAFEDPASEEWARPVRRFRDGESRSQEPLPDWWDGSTAPLVYVTFGSVAAGLGLFPDLYRAAIEAIAPVPARVLLTVGDAGDPEALGPLPGNVHVERWWPQDQVMPHTAAMVGHGGFGTTLVGLTHAVPMVVVPLFADQADNARRVEAVGAGVNLEGGRDALTGLAAALGRVLDDPSSRAGARRIADDIAALPPASAAVPVLEEAAGR